jgi:hypothetical protein
MRWQLRASAAATAFICLAFTSATLAMPAGAAAPASDDAAVSAFGGCLQAANEGSVLLLVDSSGSLGGATGTDNSNDRVKAANYLVDELTNYAQSTKIHLDAAVATFDASYRPTLGWTALSAANGPVLHGAIDNLASANTGFETDYVSALEGARAALRQHAGGSESKRCQALVWFTDGKYEIDARVNDSQRSSFGTTKAFAPGVQLDDPAGASKAQALGQTSLCRNGGTADQLRADGIETFAVGLARSGDPANFTLMKSVAIGGTGCGALGDASSGDFRLATDINSLIFAFDRVGAPGTGIAQPDRTVCQQPALCRQVHTFVLDDSIQQVQLLGSAAASGIEVYVQGPGQKAAVRLPRAASYPQRLRLGATPASYSWPAPETVSLTLERPVVPASWVGAWKVTFVDPTGTKLDTVSHTQVHILSDLRPAWLNPGEQLRAGDAKARFALGLTRSTSASVPLNPATLKSSVTLSSELRFADGTKLSLPTLTKSQITTPQSVDLSRASPGAATLHLQLQITTADAPNPLGKPIPGTRLADSVVDIPVKIASPANFPLVPDRINIGTHDAGQTFKVAIPLGGQGCTYLSKVSIDTEPAAAATSVKSAANTPASCVKSVANTQQLALTVSTRPSQAGSINGSLVMHLVSSDSPRRELTKTVSLTGDLRVSADAAVQWTVFAVALLVGILVPLLLLYLFSWLGCRIPGTRQIIYGTFPAQVVDRDVRRDGAPLRLGLSDVSQQLSVPLKGTRRLQIEGLSFKTRLGWVPFRPGIVQVRGGGPGVLLTSAERTSMAVNGQLPLNIHQSWIATPVGTGGAVTILVLLSSSASDEAAMRMAESIRRQLPDLIERTSPPGSGGASTASADAWGPASATKQASADWKFD